MKKILITTLMLLAILHISGCAKKEESSAPEYKKITPEEAKSMLDQNQDIIVLDVRTEEEFATGFIEGAILIPDYEISNKAETILIDKNASILVYCRSGRRSELATQALLELGYTNVYDMGGIIDWPYEIVTP